MNLDRLGFKAICKSTEDWAFARMAASGFGCFGIRWSDSRAEDYDGCHIYPETLCICTGLHDSNGKLIYENDIIQTEYNDKTAEFVVQYLPNDFSYEIDGKTGCCPLALVKCWIEHGEKVVVVGNKFDKEVDTNGN